MTNKENLIIDLLELCENEFTNPMIQPYSGANRECLYCGCGEDRDGRADHSAADCPVMKFQEILERYKGGG